ncbi:MAG: aldehyde dehydrogenase family protein, partial [Chloroflexota bacterium]
MTSPITRQLFINGAWTPAENNRTYKRTNPANGELVGTFSLASKADAERAVQAARTAFDSGVWTGMDSEERANIMLRTADIVLERAEEIAWWEYATTGTPLRYTRNFANSAARTFRYFAGLARDIHGDSFSFNVSQMGVTLKEPIGVCSLIVPWNFPLGEATWKVCPAIAAGCTMVVKPDSKTPVTALELGAILKEAGLPDGVYNCVVGDVADIGDTLTTHPDIDHISFTGSTHSGRIIAEKASSTLKPVHLELGGKSPLIVFADADIDAAAADAAFGVFWHLGQVCTASSRLLVEASAVDEFTERLAAHAQSMKIADPLVQDAVLGSMVSEDHLNTVMNYIARGKAEGAGVVLGGERLTVAQFDRGAYLPPT